ncbi:hypothetical protein Strvi_4459 [Streptomyces violaceusniger Tu 4113]|uniref:Uncharacterized protein n=1 Tax=Streptomyces violaceusniger (strain Tu 4113) TaxID=653045 RepID=G2NU57_STRV4|nr:hypothetical protein Strvi_4459 [Streptomyces violaceusniger Tu 4113]
MAAAQCAGRGAFGSCGVAMPAVCGEMSGESGPAAGVLAGHAFAERGGRRRTHGCRYIIRAAEAVFSRWTGLTLGGWAVSETPFPAVFRRPSAPRERRVWKVSQSASPWCGLRVRRHVCGLRNHRCPGRLHPLGTALVQHREGGGRMGHLPEAGGGRHRYRRSQSSSPSATRGGLGEAVVPRGLRPGVADAVDAHKGSRGHDDRQNRSRDAHLSDLRVLRGVPDPEAVTRWAVRLPHRPGARVRHRQRRRREPGVRARGLRAGMGEAEPGRRPQGPPRENRGPAPSRSPAVPGPPGPSRRAPRWATPRWPPERGCCRRAWPWRPGRTPCAGSGRPRARTGSHRS